MAAAEMAGLAAVLVVAELAVVAAAMKAGQVPKDAVVPQVAVTGGMAERDAAAMDSGRAGVAYQADRRGP